MRFVLGKYLSFILVFIISGCGQRINSNEAEVIGHNIGKDSLQTDAGTDADLCNFEECKKRVIQRKERICYVCEGEPMSCNLYFGHYIDKERGNFYGISYYNDETGELKIMKCGCNGDIIWEKEVMGELAGESAFIIFVDDFENLYIKWITEYIEERLWHPHSCMVFTSSSDEIIKYEQYRRYLREVWNFYPDDGKINSMTFDSDYNLYMVGEYTGSINICGIELKNTPPVCMGRGQLPPKCYYDVFITKFDREGRSVWSKSIGGSDDEYATEITIDKDGFLNVVVVSYSKSVEIDGQTIEIKSDHPFTVKFDKDGKFVGVVLDWSDILRR